MKHIASLIKPDNAGKPKPAKNAKTIKPLKIGISEAGHCPHDEMPEKVNPIIEKIIQEAI